MAWIDAFDEAALTPGAAHGFDVSGTHLIAIRVKDSVSVLSGICTHENADLSNAPVEGSTLYCPRHFSSFDATTGTVLGPPAEEPLRRYDARIENGRVWVRLDTNTRDEEAETSTRPTEPPPPAQPDTPNGPPRHTTLLEKAADSAAAHTWTNTLYKTIKPGYARLHAAGWADWLHGTKPLGHPLHPALTDLPMGLWSAAVLASLQKSYPTARTLTAAGLLTSLGSAITGVADWSVTDGQDRRIGAIHGTANVAAMAIQGASLLAHATGRHRLAGALCATGLSTTIGSAYLGGHLVFDRSAMVNHQPAPAGPRCWTPIGDETDVTDGNARAFDLNGRKIIVSHNASQWTAIEARCTHAGAPLDRGTITGTTVDCPLHGSTFSLTTGAVLRGPATRPQPTLEIRTMSGHIEARCLN